MGRQMNTGVAAVAAFLILQLAVPAATAATDSVPSRSPRPVPRAAATFGKTLPPVGFVRFCLREPEACTARGHSSRRTALTAAQWDLVYGVNSYVNLKIVPASDKELYGEVEYWAYPNSAGDCEDYALLKQRYLEGLGIPASALLLTVALDNKNEGHAVLTLATDEGDFILDNRRDDIRRWTDTDYTFLKRQSQSDPRGWVSLVGDKAIAAGAVASRAEK
ncbi:transglutaminase-like cysteine peptidase [Aestuariivirga sp.]|uniref:transglutaminase-like cysteine peptidase n=1 Tax=Aestuariivirga sp. TaxID=2650926 RepID=UPI003BA9BA89